MFNTPELNSVSRQQKIFADGFFVCLCLTLPINLLAGVGSFAHSLMVILSVVFTTLSFVLALLTILWNRHYNRLIEKTCCENAKSKLQTKESKTAEMVVIPDTVLDTTNVQNKAVKAAA